MEDTFFTGLIPDPRTDEQKSKDYQHIEIASSSSPVIWKEKTEYRTFPIRNQNGSGQCVAFSTAKTLGVNNAREKAIFAALSPRDIYTRRWSLLEMGMYLQNAGQIVKDYGATLDTLMPSDHLSEAQANLFHDRTPESEKIGLEYRATGYIFIQNDADVMDNIARKIDEGNALIFTTHFAFNEWTDEPKILVPSSEANNYHAITIVDYFLKNGEKYLLIEDSWGQEYGNKGRRILSETWVRARMTGCMYLIDWVYEPSVKPKHVFNKVLLYGQKNDDIKALQDVLKFEGLIPSNTESIGIYGPITAKGILAMQRKYSIAPLSELNALGGKRVGLKTLAYLNKNYN